jgi:hypothetical protein
MHNTTATAALKVYYSKVSSRNVDFLFFYVFMYYNIAWAATLPREKQKMLTMYTNHDSIK